MNTKREIKLVMLESGIPLIAEIEYPNSVVTPKWVKCETIRVHHPHMLKLVPAPDGKRALAIADWLMFTAEDWVDIQVSHVLYLEEADPSIVKTFKQKVSGIALPPEGLITP